MADSARQFFDTMFGNLQRQVVVLSVNRAENQIVTPQFHRTLGGAAQDARNRDDRGEDVWYGCALVDGPPGRGRRGNRSDMRQINAVWFDLDFASDSKNPNNPPDLATARNLWMNLAAGEAEPSTIVDSGHGLHCYWLLDQPLIDMDRADRLLRGFAGALHHAGEQYGWVFDQTADLTRVLRVPGTHNRKDAADVKRVEVVQQSDVRYTVAQLEAMCVERPSRAASGAVDADWPTITLDSSRRLDRDTLDRIEQLDPTLYDAIRGRSSRVLEGSPDPSSIDMSVARRCYDLGMTDQQAHDAICQSRSNHGFDIEKLGRRDYLPRTLAKARASSEENRHEQDFGPPPPQAKDRVQVRVPHEESRRESLKVARGMLRMAICAVRQVGYGEGKARYEVELDDGQVLRLGKVQRLLNQVQFHGAVMEHGIGPPAKLKGADWHRVVQCLMEAVEVYQIPEQNIEAETGKWLRSYLAGGRQIDHSGTRDQMVRVLRRGNAAALNGELYIAADSLAKHIRISFAEKIELGDLHNRLQAMGFGHETLDGGVHVWRAPMDAMSEWLPEQERERDEAEQ